MKSRAADGFAEGVRLFNQARFFEAHEVWEEIWKKAPPEEKIFYQGMIQAAAALVHVHRGNYRGAVSLYSKARGKLDRLPAPWMGIDVSEFRNDLARYFKVLRSSFGSGGEGSGPALGQTATRFPPTIRWALDER